MEHMRLVMFVQGIVSKNPGAHAPVQSSLPPPRQNDSSGHSVHTRFSVAVQGVVSNVPAEHIGVHTVGFSEASGQNVSVGHGKQNALPAHGL
jgi:hypothetical protein